MTATLTRSDTVDTVERPDLDKQRAPARTTRTVRNPSRVSAGDLMVPAATIQADESLWQAAQRLKVGPHRHLVALAKSRRLPVGVIDRKALVRDWPSAPVMWPQRTVSQVTPDRVHSVLPDASAIRVASIMRADDVDAVPVVDRSGDILGLVTARELIGMLADHEAGGSESVEDEMTRRRLLTETAQAPAAPSCGPTT